MSAFINRGNHKLTPSLLKVADGASNAVLLVLLVVGGCSRDKSVKYELANIGNFYADAPGGYSEESFVVPAGFDESLLGLSVQGSPQQLPNAIALSTNLDRLRFSVQVFQGNSTNDFYHADVPIGTNCGYCPLWKPDFGVLIGGVEPFPYAWAQTKSNCVAGYTYGRNIFPVKNGTLRTNLEYRLRLTIISPIPLTNRLQLWLYSYRK
jgi:hypothetical protein